MSRRLFSSLAISLLAACSTTPSERIAQVALPPPDAATAVVVVFRPQALDHAPRMPEIQFNGAPVCELGNGRALVRRQPPGKVTVTTQLWDWPGTSSVTFDAEAGKTYFVRMSPHYDKRIAGLLGGHPGVWLAEAIADRPGPFLLDLVPEVEATASLTQLGATPCGQ